MIDTLKRLRVSLKPRLSLIALAFLINFTIYFAFPIINYLINPGGENRNNRESIKISLDTMNIAKPKKKKKKKLKIQEPKKIKPRTKATPDRFKMKFGSGSGTGAGAVDSGMKNIVYDENEVEVEPVRVSGRLPQKPEAARNAGVGGYVELEIVIDETGTVSSVKVVQATEGYGFKEACISAVWRWRFRPALIKNIPVACRRIQPFRF